MSSNFQGGKPLVTKDDKPLRYEDAAHRVTVTGWACIKCGLWYGDNEGSERAARYCCHTDAPCPECDNRKERHRVRCESCHHKHMLTVYAAMEQVEIGEPFALSLWDGDERDYWFDEDSFIEHCMEVDTKPSDMFIVLCKQHNPGPFEIGDYIADYLPGEDGDIPDPDGARVAEDAVNHYIETNVPFSWYPDHKRRPSDAELARLDAAFAEARKEKT